MIPVIDMQTDSAAADLVQAFETIGFATLVNHGVDEVAMAFEASAKFFALPESTKLECKYQSHASNRGYIPFQAESHAHNQPDHKETFDIGWDKGTVSEFVTPWPKEQSTTTSSSKIMKEQLEEYFIQCDKLHLRVMRMLGEGMQLQDADFFVKRCNEKHCNLRLLHYPELTDEHYLSQPVLIRGGRHTDFGTITLLRQDAVGGLRVQKRGETEWVPVPPVPNSFVVNVGDMLQRWTNDRLVATPHQVVYFNDNKKKNNNQSLTQQQQKEQQQQTSIPERYSIAFFCNANKDVILDPRDFSSDPKYEPIQAMDYITGRLSDTIAMSRETTH